MSFNKTWYQLTWFLCQPSTTDDANQGYGSMQRESYF